ncbi:MAG: TIM-barrel domain-containing protein [Spirochaetia bacterium]
MGIQTISVVSHSRENRSLVVCLSNGYKVHFQTNEKDIFHVLFEKPTGLKLPQTWQIAPGLADIEDIGYHRLAVPGFSVDNVMIDEDESSLSFSVVSMQVLISKKSFGLKWQYKHDGGWQTFCEDRESQPYHFFQSNPDSILHYTKRGPDDEYYGLGEKSGHLKRNGRRFRFLNIDAMGYDSESTDPLYKHIPFLITRHKKLGISSAFFYDNLSDCSLDLGQEMDNYHGHYRYFQAKGGDLDFYVMAKTKIKDLTQSFSWLTGKTLFPPKWSLYYSGSTMSYTDAPNAQELFYTFLEDCKKYNIPCQSFQLSSGYTTIGNLRLVFNWNHEKFPNFKKLAADFMQNNIRFCANIKPALLEEHPMFGLVQNHNYFIKEAESEDPELFQFWDGLGAALDFTNPAAAQWWKTQVTEKLLDFGIVSTWNDNNEHELWDDRARCYGFGETIEIGEIRPLFALLMMRASFQAQKSHAPNKRPYLISRSGPSGIQRYAQTWSGDNYTAWKTLKFNNYMGLSLSLCGMYNFGHDIGGFSGPAPEPELLIRWMQHAIFWPRYTIHSWNDDESANVPWMYESHLAYAQEALALRNYLIPSIYNLLYKSHMHYEAILKPLFYDFEDDKACDPEDDNFLMGNILAAPVIEKGATQKKVYLPKSTNWYAADGMQLYEGGTHLDLEVSLGSIPYFIKEGTVLGLNSAESCFKRNPDYRLFAIYPVKKAYFEDDFFEDDGESYGFENGDFLQFHFHVECDTHQVRVQITKSGNFTPPYRAVEVSFPKIEARSIHVNGVQIENYICNVNLSDIQTKSN